MNGLETFAEEARKFCRWAEGDDSSMPMNARDALIRLITLYQAALFLPTPWTNELPDEDNEPPYTLDDFNIVFGRAGSLPFRSYSEVFDPLAEPQEQAIYADICADVAEVYEDIIRGLRMYESEKPFEARYKWGWSFQNHWGEHTTAAIRALHVYLSQNSPDQLVDQA